MRQVLQSLKTGEVSVASVPSPKAYAKLVSIRTSVSLVSTGTERMLLDFGRGNLLSKALQQPDRVKDTLQKARTDGLAATFDAVRNKLDQPIPLGYSIVGTVEEKPPTAVDLAIGDRVVTNGHHSDVVLAGRNLIAKVPPEVDDESAAFTVLGAIALQGIRLAQPTLGECVVVTGLGLVGLLAVQLLRAHGCRVMGIDYDAQKVDLAREMGALGVDLSKGEDPISAAESFSSGNGIDAVIVAASTSSNEPISQAATMCRKRGRIVLIGVVGMEISRSDFYEKELSFQVSCSYGPGRYDSDYEIHGHDYPLPYVRWTEQRNFEAVLDMMANGHLDVKPLISHRFDIEKAASAYDVLAKGNPLGILLDYSSSRPTNSEKRNHSEMVVPKEAKRRDKCRIAFVGAGNFATQVLIPSFSSLDAELAGISCQRGVSGLHAARKFGIQEVTTDSNELVNSDSNDAIVISTRHNSHADLTVRGLKAGKHVYVEKPLAINQEQLSEIEKAYDGESVLMVGFNRRYSPLVTELKRAMDSRPGPASFVYTINAGQIPHDHWTQIPDIGGGRIIGEVCHFIDLLRYLSASPVKKWSAIGSPSLKGHPCDNATVQLQYENEAIGAIHYLSNGNKLFPKERLEVFSNGGIIQIDNFRRLRSYGWTGCKSRRLLRQNKGHDECAQAFITAATVGERQPIPFAELVETTSLAISIAAFLDR